MNKVVHIEQKELTPLIYLDSDKNVMKLKGICVPENAYDFFQPVFNWLEQYQCRPNKNGKFEFELDYFNTSSSRMLLEVMKKIKKIPSQEIIWTFYQDDEDLGEVVNDYNELLDGIILLNIKKRGVAV